MDMENNQENKKGFFSISKGLVFILLVVLFGFWGFYAYHFQGGLSSDQLRWSQFGDFFNGVVSPIFAAINICIFWYLTKVVDENNTERQSQNAEHEKNIVLMQFRKAEVDRFEDIISTALMPKVDMSDIYLYLQPTVIAINFTDSFINYRLKLFNLDNTSDIVAQTIELNDKLKKFYDWIDEKREYPDKDNDLPSSIYALKGSITSSLQKITLGEEIS